MRWPWQRARHLKDHRFYSRWPKKVYFLDGPMAGKTGTSHGGYFVPVIYMKAPSRPTNFFEGDYELSSMPESVYDHWRYDWETCYPCAEVAYVRFTA